MHRILINSLTTRDQIVSYHWIFATPERFPVMFSGAFAIRYTDAESNQVASATKIHQLFWSISRKWDRQDWYPSESIPQIIHTRDHNFKFLDFGWREVWREIGFFGLAGKSYKSRKAGKIVVVFHFFDQLKFVKSDEILFSPYSSFLRGKEGVCHKFLFRRSRNLLGLKSHLTSHFSCVNLEVIVQLIEKLSWNCQVGINLPNAPNCSSSSLPKNVPPDFFHLHKLPECALFNKKTKKKKKKKKKKFEKIVVFIFVLLALP